MADWNMKRTAYLTGYMSGGMGKTAKDTPEAAVTTAVDLQNTGMNMAGDALSTVDPKMLAKLLLALGGAGVGAAASKYIIPDYIKEQYPLLANLGPMLAGGAGGYMAGSKTNV